jgi:hypothetical protein
MATISATFPSLIDAHKASGAGEIIEVLNQYNPVLDDAVATECNLGMEHMHSIRTGLPSVAWGRLYQGVPQSKSTLQQVKDTTGFLETMSGIDVRLLKLAKDKAKARLTSAMPYLEAMSQEMATGLFYHSTRATPEKFRGLADRYSAYGTRASTDASRQVIDGGGSGNANTSIWFVTWGDHATTLLYPEGTQAGVQHEDKGEQRVLDASGNPYFVKESLWTWHMGVAVTDWRYNARIANIDVAAMLAGSTDIYDLMTTAYYRLHSRRRDAKSSRIAIYANGGVLEALDKLASGKGTAVRSPLQLSQKEIEGKEVLTFRNIPIREVDALLNTEANVPAA